MKRSALGALIAFAAFGCTTAPPATGASAAAASCIDSDRIIARRTAGPAAVDFEVLGGITYRNRLASTCPGLERLGTAAVVAVTSTTGGGRLCEGDRVRIYDPVEVKATGVQGYPECRLGRFVPLPG